MAGKIQKQDVKTVAELVAAGASAADLIQDTQIYVTANSLNKQLSAAIADKDIGAPGVGGIDYFVGSINLAKDTSGISTYDDTGAYVDGTGGSPSAVTISRRTSSPLDSDGDLQISKAASSATGEGVTLLSDSIDIADRGRKLWISFEWDGTAANYPTGDFKLYAYDVTNSAILPVLPVAGCQFDSSSRVELSNLRTKVQAYIIPPSTCTQVRVSLHCPTDNASSSAYDVYVARPRLSPDATVPGAIITEWQDFPSVAAGTLITASTTNPTYGTVTHNKAQWRRVGSNMEIHWSFRQSTAGTVGSGDYFFNLPPGYSIDSTKIQFSAGTGEGNLRGTCGTFESVHHGSSHWFGQVHAFDATRLQACFQYQGFGGSTAGGAGVWGSGYGSFSIAPLTVNVRVSVPILGWSASAALTTTEIGLQTVQVIAEKNSGSHTSSGSWQDISWTETYDNFNCFDGTTFTCRKAGTYAIAAAVTFSSNSAGVRNSRILVNGNPYLETTVTAASTDSFGRSSFSLPIRLQVNDTLKIQAYQTSGGTLAYSTVSPALTRLSITEVPDLTTFAPLFDNTDVELYVDSPSGHGSTNTRIRHFPPANIRKQTGRNVYYTYDSDSTLGARITILVPGLYQVKYVDGHTSSPGNIGLSVNATALSTDVISLNYSQGYRLINSYWGNGNASGAITERFKAGDVIRPHNSGTLPNRTGTECALQLIRIGN